MISAADVNGVGSPVSTLHAKGSTGRRQQLPCNGPHSSGGIMKILRQNIGKDLSKISMPVTMNEPLNALQVTGVCACVRVCVCVCVRACVCACVCVVCGSCSEK